MPAKSQLAAGELLGRTGLTGYRCALDALVAVVALAQPRPVVLLTSDVAGLAVLTEEPGAAQGGADQGRPQLSTRRAPGGRATWWPRPPGEYRQACDRSR